MTKRKSLVSKYYTHPAVHSAPFCLRSRLGRMAPTLDVAEATFIHNDHDINPAFDLVDELIGLIGQPGGAP